MVQDRLRKKPTASKMQKKCIKKINYSPSQIEIELSLSEPTDDKRAGDRDGFLRAGSRPPISSASSQKIYDDFGLVKNLSNYDSFESSLGKGWLPEKDSNLQELY